MPVSAQPLLNDSGKEFSPPNHLYCLQEAGLKNSITVLQIIMFRSAHRYVMLCEIREEILR